MSRAVNYARYPGVIVPDMCQRHQYDLIITRLEIPEHGQWQEAYAATQRLLLHFVLEDGQLKWQSGYRTMKLNLALAAIGCLACYRPADYERALRIVREGPMFTKGVMSDAGDRRPH
jgi:hypothetical protein